MKWSKERLVLPVRHQLINIIVAALLFVAAIPDISHADSPDTGIDNDQRISEMVIFAECGNVHSETLKELVRLRTFLSKPTDVLLASVPRIIQAVISDPSTEYWQNKRFCFAVAGEHQPVSYLDAVPIVDWLNLGQLPLDSQAEMLVNGYQDLVRDSISYLVFREVVDKATLSIEDSPIIDRFIEEFAADYVQSPLDHSNNELVAARLSHAVIKYIFESTEIDPEFDELLHKIGFKEVGRLRVSLEFIVENGYVPSYAMLSAIVSSYQPSQSIDPSFFLSTYRPKDYVDPNKPRLSFPRGLEDFRLATSKIADLFGLNDGRISLSEITYRGIPDPSAAWFHADEGSKSVELYPLLLQQDVETFVRVLIHEFTHIPTTGEKSNTSLEVQKQISDVRYKLAEILMEMPAEQIYQLVGNYGFCRYEQMLLKLSTLWADTYRDIEFSQLPSDVQSKLGEIIPESGELSVSQARELWKFLEELDEKGLVDINVFRPIHITDEVSLLFRLRVVEGNLIGSDDFSELTSELVGNILTIDDSSYHFIADKFPELVKEVENFLKNSTGNNYSLEEYRKKIDEITTELKLRRAEKIVLLLPLSQGEIGPRNADEILVSKTESSVWTELMKIAELDSQEIHAALNDFGESKNLNSEQVTALEQLLFSYRQYYYALVANPDECKVGYETGFSPACESDMAVSVFFKVTNVEFFVSVLQRIVNSNFDPYEIRRADSIYQGYLSKIFFSKFSWDMSSMSERFSSE